MLVYTAPAVSLPGSPEFESNSGGRFLCQYLAVFLGPPGKRQSMTFSEAGYNLFLQRHFNMIWMAVGVAASVLIWMLLITQANAGCLEFVRKSVRSGDKCILNLGTRWTSVFSFTHQSLCPLRKGPRYPYVDPRTGLDAVVKNSLCPCRESNPGSLALIHALVLNELILLYVLGMWPSQKNSTDHCSCLTQ